MDTLRFLRGKLRLRMVRVRVSDLHARSGEAFQAAFGGISRTISDYVIAVGERAVEEVPDVREFFSTGGSTFCFPIRGPAEREEENGGGGVCECREGGFRARLRRRRWRRRSASATRARGEGNVDSAEVGGVGMAPTPLMFANGFDEVESSLLCFGSNSDRQLPHSDSIPIVLE